MFCLVAAAREMFTVVHSLVRLRRRRRGVICMAAYFCGSGGIGERRIHFAHSPCPGPRRQYEDYGEQAGNEFSRSNH